MLHKNVAQRVKIEYKRKYYRTDKSNQFLKEINAEAESLYVEILREQ